MTVGPTHAYNITSNASERLSFANLRKHGGLNEISPRSETALVCLGLPTSLPRPSMFYYDETVIDDVYMLPKMRAGRRRRDTVSWVSVTSVTVPRTMMDQTATWRRAQTQTSMTRIVSLVSRRSNSDTKNDGL